MICTSPGNRTLSFYENWESGRFLEAIMGLKTALQLAKATVQAGAALAGNGSVEDAAAKVVKAQLAKKTAAAELSAAGRKGVQDGLTAAKDTVRSLDKTAGRWDDIFLAAKKASKNE
jgi:hypothetical protein